MTVSEADRKILAEALERFDSCVTSSSHIREDYKDDIRFVFGDHWPENVKKTREADNRPCLVVNKIPQYVNQVVNDQRQNRPAIKVRPVDSGADPATADVINGVIRHIANDSNAKAAFDHACDYAVMGGIGFIRIVTDYVDDQSFEQCIKVERVEDSLSVYFPIHICQKADYSDAPYCFVLQTISKKEFEARYPKASPSDWDRSGDASRQWITDDTVTIAEYFTIEETAKQSYMLADGTTTDALMEGVEAVKTRDVTVRTVKRYLLTAGEILEKEQSWPSRWLPIVPVLAKELIVDGKKHYVSLVRNSKDPQRMYNYWKSCETEMIALAPKAPFIGAEGQFIGHEKEWGEANIKNLPYLEYKPVTYAGQAVGAPQRVQQAQIPNAIVNAIQEASDDIKSTTGIYDSSMGAQSNETSGRAILARQKQGDKANFHFIDNLNHAIQHCGRIIVDLIPQIYDTPRIVRIVGEDEVEKVVAINQMTRSEKGEDVLYSFTTGKYDVVVDTGPSYATKRQETAETLMEFLQAVPSVGQVAPDLLVKTMDFSGHEELAERLKRTIPPEILGEQGQGEEGPTEEDLQAIVGDLEKLSAENEQVKAALQQAQAELADKQADRELEIEKTVIQSQSDIERERVKQSPDAMNAILMALQDIAARLDVPVPAPSFSPVSAPQTEQDNVEIIP